MYSKGFYSFLTDKASGFSKLYPTVILGLCFTYVVFASAQLYGSTLFFEWDEWSFLANLTQNSNFSWLFQVHLGHFQPIGRLIYLIEVSLFKDNYGLYVICNYAVHLLNTFLLYFLLKKLEVKAYVAAGAALVFVVHAAHMENLTWGMQIMLLVSTTSILVALIGTVKYLATKNLTWLITTVFACFIGAFTFEFALPSATFCLVLTASTLGKREIFKSSNSKVLLTLFITQCTLALLWVLGSSIDVGFYVHPDATHSPNPSLSIPFIIDAVKFVAIGLPNSILFSLTGFKLGLQPFSIILSFVMLSGIVFWGYKITVNKPTQRGILIAALFMLSTMLLMVAVSRLQLPMIYQSRYYVFFMVPGLILACILIPSDNRTLCKTGAGTLLLFSATLFFPHVGSKFAPAFVQIEPTAKVLKEWWKYDKGLEIRELWDSNENRNESELWFPKANPELTVGQKMDIHRLLNSE